MRTGRKRSPSPSFQTYTLILQVSFSLAKFYPEQGGEGEIFYRDCFIIHNEKWVFTVHLVTVCSFLFYCFISRMSYRYLLPFSFETYVIDWRQFLTIDIGYVIYRPVLNPENNGNFCQDQKEVIRMIFIPDVIRCYKILLKAPSFF